MSGAAALLAALAVAMPALGAEPAAPLHIATFEDSSYHLSLTLVNPFERMLREDEAALSVLRVESIAAEFNGDEYRYRLPPHLMREGLPAAPEGEEREVEYLEVPGGFFLLTPSSAPLLDRFLELIRDQASYPMRRVPEVRRLRARLAAAPAADGGVTHTLRLVPADRVRHPGWLNTVALVYRIRDAGRERHAVFIFKTRGGEGRVAAALDSLRARFGADLLVLNRGQVFVLGHTKTTGTSAGHRFAGMGVRASVPSFGDLYRIQDAFDYRRERPDGVAFLSANLVYSTATATTVFPAYRVFRAGGKRVAVLGLTRPTLRKYFRSEDVERYAIGDPVAAALQYVPLLRAQADIVVALTNLDVAENARLKQLGQGLDLIAGDGCTFVPGELHRSTEVRESERGEFGEALLVSWDCATLLSHIEVRHRAEPGGKYSLSLREDHILLDEQVPDRAGYPKFNPLGFGVTADTRSVILPSLRRLYGDRPDTVGVARLSERAFWKLVASLAADHAGAEAGCMPVTGISQNTTGDFKESLVREWFHFKDDLVVFKLPGGALRELAAEAARQDAPGAGVAAGGSFITLGGVGEGGKIHGAAIDGKSVYRLVGTRRLLAMADQYPALAKAEDVEALGNLENIILEQLRRGASRGWTVERYRALLAGRSNETRGLWKVNFRDIGLNVSNTKVVRDEAFSDVPNARVQGFDELLIGATFKTDLEFYRGPHKWTNAAELEYSKSRLRPPAQPAILNTPKNRTMLRSVETLRVGAFPWRWFAASFGPSLGAQYDGHVERIPLQRRKHIVSVLPGVELFGGTLVRSCTLSANLRRDFTPTLPVNQYGIQARALVSQEFGRLRLQGEVLGNYFFLTPQDTSQDLRLEFGSNFKLHIPIYKDFTLAPYIDFYYFTLKTRPLAGYSTITGIALSFSRLWKPQYEPFF
ncbi:MAG: hypothetical protein ABIJ96_16985 [Elusimicrobiota bacterium]